MADINVERKNRSPWLWWIAALIIAALILWWIIAAVRGNRGESEPMPAATTPTVEPVAPAATPGTAPAGAVTPGTMAPGTMAPGATAPTAAPAEPSATPAGY